MDTNTTTTSEGCWNLDNDECLEITEWNDKYIDGDVIKSGIFGELGDTAGGIISLIFSLTVLCIALYNCKNLAYYCSSRKRAWQNSDALVNVITKNGAMSILFGMLLQFRYNRVRLQPPRLLLLLECLLLVWNKCFH